MSFWERRANQSAWLNLFKVNQIHIISYQILRDDAVVIKLHIYEDKETPALLFDVLPARMQTESSYFHLMQISHNFRTYKNIKELAYGRRIKIKQNIPFRVLASAHATKAQKAYALESVMNHVKDLFGENYFQIYMLGQMIGKINLPSGSLIHRKFINISLAGNDNIIHNVQTFLIGTASDIIVFCFPTDKYKNRHHEQFVQILKQTIMNNLEPTVGNVRFFSFSFINTVYRETFKNTGDSMIFNEYFKTHQRRLIYGSFKHTNLITDEDEKYSDLRLTSKIYDLNPKRFINAAWFDYIIPQRQYYNPSSYGLVMNEKYFWPGIVL